MFQGFFVGFCSKVSSFTRGSQNWGLSAVSREQLAQAPHAVAVSVIDIGNSLEVKVYL